MRIFLRFLAIFFLLLIITFIAVNVFNVNFGKVDYWHEHGIFFLIFIAFFPRLTLLFSSIPFGGLFWWLGFFFAPRLLIAMLATIAYGITNPILVAFAWLFALGGETYEKYYVYRVKKRYSYSYSNIDHNQNTNTFEAEYTVKQ